MTDSAERILERPARLRLRLDALLERRSECASPVTARYGGSRASPYRDRGDGPLTARADLGSRIEDCRRDLERAEAEAEAVLGRVASMPGRTAPRDAELLRLRHLRGLSWEEIRLALAARGWSCGTSRTVHNWAASALRRARAVLRDGDRDGDGGDERVSRRARRDQGGTL